MAIISFENLLNVSKQEGLSICEIAQIEESKHLEISIDDVRRKTLDNLIAMKAAIKNGLNSTEKSVSNWCGDDAMYEFARFSPYLTVQEMKQLKSKLENCYKS